MTSIDNILLIGGITASTIALLGIREFAVAWNMPRGHIERGPHWFNASVCILLALCIFYGSSVLNAHKHALDKIISAYPAARYAPEREVLTPGKNWIYVSRDTTGEIVQYYRSRAHDAGYLLTENIGTSTSRLLFARDASRLFLTIDDEGDVRVLYYSENGEVEVYTVPSP